jgi:hypothetical protein
VDATVAVLHIKQTYDLVFAPATVRSWANRGRIQRYGTGRSGVHFDLNEIDQYIRGRIQRGDVAS